MAELPAHSDAGNDPEVGVGSDMGAIPRWVKITGIAVISIIVVVVAALHLFGVVGPLAD